VETLRERRAKLTSTVQQLAIEIEAYGFNSNASMKFRVNGFQFIVDG
jgi:hypothetical protein